MFYRLFPTSAVLFCASISTWASSHGVSDSCISINVPNISGRNSKLLSNSFPSNRESSDLHTKWSGAEHKQLGDLGFSQICQELNLDLEICKQNQLNRADGKIKMTYGQVVALGDFYLSPEKAFLETKRSSSLSKLFKCIDKEGKVHDTQKEHPEVEYPDCTWVNVLYGGEYLKVVSNNMDHFAWDNVKAYVKHHERALKYAEAAYLARAQGQEENELLLLNKALYINAFADHFLTDAFPAGHLRVPRKEINQWAKKNLGSVFKSYIADALSMILHDNEGRNLLGEEVGIHVLNSLDIDWQTRSDKQLNVCASEDDLHIQMPLLSVKSSIKEIFSTYISGRAPDSVFQAINYVPFPSDIGFAEKWKAVLEPSNQDSFIGKMRNQLPIPLRWIVEKKHIKRLLEDLPEVLDAFNSRVRREAESNLQLTKRLPSSYLENFQNLK